MNKSAFLDMVLSIDHRKHGLSLGQDATFVYLIKDGKAVATWYDGPALTVAQIHEEADKYLPGQDAVQSLIEIGGIGFGRS